MGLRLIFTCLFLTLLASLSVSSLAAADPVILEQCMSETLDLWREGRFEQLYDRLARRGKLSREQFVRRMRESAIRPACCWQKLENVSLVSEKGSTATVYARVGLEGTSSAQASSTREFKLTREAEVWKMQLGDITGLAGLSSGKGHPRKKSKHTLETYHY